MKIGRRRFLALAGGWLAGSLATRSSAADSWPSRPVRVVVPFSAGSTTDVVGRVIVEQLAAQLGQPFVVENRGGAGGTIASAAVLQTPADGYTIMVHSSGHSAVPAVYTKASYDPARDFRGIASFGSVPNVLVIAPSKGIKTVKELIEASKGGNMTFASAGPGSASHWAAERFRLSTGIQALHIPFRGGPEGLTEVMTGRVDFMCVGVSSSRALIQDGALQPIAVTTRTRSSSMPDVPSTIELGYQDSDYIFWNGIIAAAQTPQPIVDRLHAEVQKALAHSGVKEKFASQGIEPMPVTPAEFDATIKSEIAINLALVKAAGLKFN